MIRFSLMVIFAHGAANIRAEFLVIELLVGNNSQKLSA